MVLVEDVVHHEGYLSVEVAALRQLAERGVDVVFLAVGDVDYERASRLDVDVGKLYQGFLAVAVDEVRLEADDFVVIHLRILGVERVDVGFVFAHVGHDLFGMPLILFRSADVVFLVFHHRSVDPCVDEVGEELDDLAEVVFGGVPVFHPIEEDSSVEVSVDVLRVDFNHLII